MLKETTEVALASCRAEKGDLDMLVGCYYRCPIVVEEGDKDHPRFMSLLSWWSTTKLPMQLK